MLTTQPTPAPSLPTAYIFLPSGVSAKAIGLNCSVTLLITALLLAEIAATLGDVGGTVVVLPMFATYIVPFSVVWTKTGLKPKGRLVVTGVRLISAYDEIVTSRLLATYIRLPFGNKAACTGRSEERRVGKEWREGV